MICGDNVVSVRQICASASELSRPGAESQSSSNEESSIRQEDYVEG